MGMSTGSSVTRRPPTSVTPPAGQGLSGVRQCLDTQKSMPICIDDIGNMYTISSCGQYLTEKRFGVLRTPVEG